VTTGMLFFTSDFMYFIISDGRAGPRFHSPNAQTEHFDQPVRPGREALRSGGGGG